MLRPDQLDVVESTAPVLAQRGEEITRHFYRRMFAGHPEVAPYFNPAHQAGGAQPRALADAIVAFASNVRHLDRLGPAVERIGHKHASLGVRPEHYPIVGEHLLASIQEVLEGAATPAVLEAWGAAYQLLADVLIGREAQLYDDHTQRHGWRGFRDLVVAEKVRESDCITSFVLTDPNGAQLGRGLPGQYLTVRAPAPGPSTTMRNYSLSRWADDDTYRISVKREPAASADTPAGHVSNWLHDSVVVGSTIEVAPPSGDFFLDPNTVASEASPLVLLSGGVGVTPLLAMLEYAARTSLPRDVHFLHCARTESSRAFREEVCELAAGHGRTTVHVRYSHDPQGACDSHGFVDEAFLESALPSTGVDVYLCGPAPFMAASLAALRAYGVDEARVRYESFGPLETFPDAVAAPV